MTEDELSEDREWGKVRLSGDVLLQPNGCMTTEGTNRNGKWLRLHFTEGLPGKSVCCSTVHSYALVKVH